jgi:glycosyltransferase involved in cell wall biosynthesis
VRVSIVVPGRWHAFDLARELGELGHLGQLITTYPKRIVRRYGVDDQAVVSLASTEVLRRAVWRLPPGHIDAVISRQLLSRFARQAAARLEPCDVVVAWSGVGAPAFARAAKWGALRVCERGSSHIVEQEQILAEEHLLHGMPWLPWGDAGRRLDLDDYEAADIVSIPSLFVKRSFLAQGYPEDRLLLAPYGVDLNSFRAGPGPGGLARIVFAGSLSIRKGVGYLVAGFRRAALENSQLWLIGGETRETRDLLGPTDANVRLFGHVAQDRLPDLYRQGSAFVLPSVEEGLALVQLQALACGLPLICTTNTGGEDLLQMSLPDGAEPESLVADVTRYPAGYLVPVRRPDSIAVALQDLHASPDRLAAMRKAAEGVASRALSWRASAERRVTAYQEVAARLGRSLA